MSSIKRETYRNLAGVEVTSYLYRNTVIEPKDPTTGYYVVSGFGPFNGGWTIWRTLADARRYIDSVKDDDIVDPNIVARAMGPMNTLA